MRVYLSSTSRSRSPSTVAAGTGDVAAFVRAACISGAVVNAFLGVAYGCASPSYFCLLDKALFVVFIGLCDGWGLWSSGDIRATFPGIISGYGFAGGINNVVYRGYLGYIPGFRVYLHYVGCKTELLSSAWNITHRTSLSLILLHGVLIGV